MRLEKLRTFMKEEKLDVVLIASPANIRYFSGFSGGDSYLYVSKEKQVILTDSRYTLQAEEESRDFPVLTISGARGFGVLLSELLKDDEAEHLGFEDEAMLYGSVCRLQEQAGIPVDGWIPLEEKLSALRRIKEEQEIAYIARAAQIGDQAFSYILKELKTGVTEFEIAAKLEYYMRTHGAEDKSFAAIVASGAHSAMPHAVPTAKRLEYGDFVTLDFGCKYRGYCSDMTRTVVIGKASEEQKKIYGTVLRAQEAALAGLKPGMTGAQGDLLAREVIEQAGYGAFFGHALGHSVGLEIHEKPVLSPRDTTVLQAGMIETVEPGIYVPGVGGVRIEDLVVFTEDECRILTDSCKKLIEL